MPVQRPHFPDLLFEQTERFRKWERLLSDLFTARGFREVSPSLVTATLKDHSVRCLDGEKVVGLRWDFTEALAALLATRFFDAPGRVSYRGAVFRKPVSDWEPVERFEVGVEYVSQEISTSDVDRELLSLLLEVPSRIGLQGGIVQLGSAALFAIPIAKENIDDALARELAGWLSKRATHRVYDTLNGHAARDRLVKHMECLIHGELQASPYLSELHGARAELEATAAYARSVMQPSISLRIDMADVAGFGVYTGPTVRLWAPHAAFELGAGGRYDRLYPSLGKPWNAAGFCIRLARLMDLEAAHPELFVSSKAEPTLASDARKST
jgi:ATP phosphoribosyltransferase regulatory subunit